MDAPQSTPRGSSYASSPPNILLAFYMVAPFGEEVIGGIQNWLDERGLVWRIHVCDSRRGYRAGVRWMTGQKRLDGVITDFHNGAEMRVLRRAGVPVVWLGPDRDESVAWERGYAGRFAIVKLDSDDIARAALDHFLSRSGFRSFGFVESPWDFGWSKPRGNAWERECRRRGLPHTRFLHWARFAPLNPPEGPDYAGLAEWLRSLDKPAAVLCASDETAKDVLDACDGLGLPVPGQISVLGMDDRPFIWRYTRPSLSSIHFDKRLAGRLCAQAMDGLLTGATESGKQTVSMRYGVREVVQRASTGAVSTSGQMVQRALDYISANATTRDIKIDGVAAAVGVSRALLTRRFRETLDRSVLDAVHAARVEAAVRLLVETDSAETLVARDSGFGSVDAMRRVFRDRLGSTPSAVRRERPRRNAPRAESAD